LQLFPRHFETLPEMDAHSHFVSRRKNSLAGPAGAISLQVQDSHRFKTCASSTVC